MAKGEKYIALTVYLEKCGKDVLKLSFKEIESILGMPLPNSAYVHQTLWANTESHSIAFGWMNAGYATRNVDIENQTVEFMKNGNVAKNVIKPVNSIVKKAAVKRTPLLSVEDAIKCIQSYFDDTVKDSHGRYWSWCHCYNAFKENRNNRDEKTIDYLSLHLAFYLASWGMLRGSTFLLQKDYKVHTPIVKLILEEKYNPLLGVTAEGLQDDGTLDLLDDISTRIRETYAKEEPSFKKESNDASDTLVTKILLGTLGCVPAYDRYYVEAVRKYKISAGVYNRKSVKDVANYYLMNKEAFEKVRNEMNLHGVEYPVMKIMDMCMWQVAFENDSKNKQK